MHSLDLPSRVFLLCSINSLFLSFAKSSNVACYFPDKTVAKNYVSCSPTQNGGCCQDSDICTEWGYCVSQSKGYHYRGACTDSTWGNPSCPDYCLGSSSGNNSFVNVIACNVAETDGTWCCAYDGNCCSGSSTFIAGFGTMFPEPGSLLITSAASGSTLVSASTTASTSSTTSQFSPIHVIASTSAPSATNTPVPANSTSSPPTIVGAVVGVSLGLAFIAALFLFHRERRKRMNPRASGLGMGKGDDAGGVGSGGNSAVSVVLPNGALVGGFHAQNSGELLEGCREISGSPTSTKAE